MKKEDAIIVLVEAMAMGDASGAIVAQEARGQQAFVASTVLPIECSGCTRDQLEAMGITFGDAIDDLFIEA